MSCQCEVKDCLAVFIAIDQTTQAMISVLAHLHANKNEGTNVNWNYKSIGCECSKA